eukprot:7184196-Prymnesium_polylepis.1
MRPEREDESVTRQAARQAGASRPALATDPLVQYAFSRFDANQSGQIDIEELLPALGYLGIPATTLQQAKNVLAQYSNDDSLGLDDFSRLVADVRAFEVGNADVSSELKSAFSAFDTDNDGRIDAKELQVALKQLGETQHTPATNHRPRLSMHVCACAVVVPSAVISTPLALVVTARTCLLVAGREVTMNEAVRMLLRINPDGEDLSLF